MRMNLHVNDVTTRFPSLATYFVIPALYMYILSEPKSIHFHLYGSFEYLKSTCETRPMPENIDEIMTSGVNVPVFV